MLLRLSLGVLFKEFQTLLLELLYLMLQNLGVLKLDLLTSFKSRGIWIND